MYQTNRKNNERKVMISMTKDEFINYLYFILDKVDSVYYKEIHNSIEKFINNKVNYE